MVGACAWDDGGWSVAGVVVIVVLGVIVVVVLGVVVVVGGGGGAQMPALEPLLSSGPSPDFIQQFCSITNADEAAARHFYEVSGGSIEQAMSIFFL